MVMGWIMWLAGMAWAGDFYVELGPLPERAEAQETLGTIREAGLEGRIVRRFRLGEGWEFMVLVEHIPTRADADRLASRLGTETRRPVTVYEIDTEEHVPVVQPQTRSVQDYVAAARQAHGGESGGASLLSRAEAVHFVYERTLKVSGKEQTFLHDYWREGANRRLVVDGPGVDSLAVATAGGSWLKVAAQVHTRDIGVMINQVDAFAPEAVMAVVLDVGHRLAAPEVQSFRLLEGADSGVRLGLGGREEEPGISFVDIDPATGRLLQVRYITDAGPVEYTMQDYRDVAPGLTLPFQVHIERGDGRKEQIQIRQLEIAAHAPEGSFSKPST